MRVGGFPGDFDVSESIMARKLKEDVGFNGGIKTSSKRKSYYVIKFLSPPLNMVCIPYVWVVHHAPLGKGETEQRVVVVYPRRGQCPNVRELVARRAKYDDSWLFHAAVVKWKADTLEEAETWIIERKEYGPEIEVPLQIGTLNPAIRPNPRKPLPRMAITNPDQTLYVIKWLQKPYEDIDDFACVPQQWIKQGCHKERGGRIFMKVAYPSENLPNMRELVEKREPYDGNWGFYEVRVYFQTTSYDRAGDKICELTLMSDDDDEEPNSPSKTVSERDIPKEKSNRDNPDNAKRNITPALPGCSTTPMNKRRHDSNIQTQPEKKRTRIGVDNSEATVNSSKKEQSKQSTSKSSNGERESSCKDSNRNKDKTKDTPKETKRKAPEEVQVRTTREGKEKTPKKVCDRNVQRTKHKSPKKTTELTGQASSRSLLEVTDDTDDHQTIEAMQRGTLYKYTIQNSSKDPGSLKVKILKKNEIAPASSDTNTSITHEDKTENTSTNISRKETSTHLQSAGETLQRSIKDRSNSISKSRNCSKHQTPNTSFTKTQKAKRQSIGVTSENQSTAQTLSNLNEKQQLYNFAEKLGLTPTVEPKENNINIAKTVNLNVSRQPSTEQRCQTMISKKKESLHRVINTLIKNANGALRTNNQTAVQTTYDIINDTNNAEKIVPHETGSILPKISNVSLPNYKTETDASTSQEQSNIVPPVSEATLNYQRPTTSHNTFYSKKHAVTEKQVINIPLPNPDVALQHLVNTDQNTSLQRQEIINPQMKTSTFKYDEADFIRNYQEEQIAESQRRMYDELVAKPPPDSQSITRYSVNTSAPLYQTLVPPTNQDLQPFATSTPKHIPQRRHSEPLAMPSTCNRPPARNTADNIKTKEYKKLKNTFEKVTIHNLQSNNSTIPHSQTINTSTPERMKTLEKRQESQFIDRSPVESSNMNQAPTDDKMLQISLQTVDEWNENTQSLQFETALTNQSSNETGEQQISDQVPTLVPRIVSSVEMPMRESSDVSSRNVSNDTTDSNSPATSTGFSLHDNDYSKWTLKHRQFQPQLYKLPSNNASVYVCCETLKKCLQISHDCRSFARNLLTEVFNERALSVCLTILENFRGELLDRPELDFLAWDALVMFVLDIGRKRGWTTDNSIAHVIESIDKRILEIRSRFEGTINQSRS